MQYRSFNGNRRRRIAMLAGWWLVSQCLALPAYAGDSDSETQADSTVETQVPHFEIQEYRVSGNRVLDTMDVEQTLYRFLGDDKTFDDVEQARRALEQRYRDKGFPAVLVDIPEQSVSDGIVWLRVNESRVSRVRVTGSRYYSPRDLAGQMESLKPGNRLRLSAVQDDINKVTAAYPERGLTPVLRPGGTPGTVEMELKVKDQLPVHGGIQVNDRYGENTSRWRTNISLGYSNLWQRGHALTVQYQTAPQKPNEVRVWSGTYLWRQYGSPSLFALYAVDSRSNTAALGDINVVGKGNIYGLRWISPFRGDDGGSRNLTLGVDYKSFDENIVTQGADSQATPISYMSFTAAYSMTLVEKKGSTDLNMSTVFGVRGLGNTEAEFANKRSLGQPDFFYVRAGIKQSLSLFKGSSLHLSFDGQTANSPLISNEEYAAGGSQTVRGYHESQLLGDDATHASFEWHTPSLLGKTNMPLRECYGLLFWEGATLHVKKPLPDEASRRRIASAGFGLRFRQGSNWDARLDWAKAYKSAGSVAKGDTRWHLLINYGF